MTWFGTGAGDAVRETWIEGLMSGPDGDLAEALKAELAKKHEDHPDWFALLLRAYFGDPSSSQLRPLGKQVATLKTAIADGCVEIECVFSGAEILKTSSFPFDGKDMDVAFFSQQLSSADAALAAVVKNVEVKSGDRFPRVALCRIGLDRWADNVICRVFLVLDSMGGVRAYRTGETTKVKVVLGRG